jgi:hypothetical protein
MKTLKQTARRSRRYDREMIHDFLRQLLLELWVSHLEHTNRGTSDPEMDEQVKPLVKKHGIKLVYGLSFQDVTEDQQVEKVMSRSSGAPARSQPQRPGPGWRRDLGSLA